MSAQKLLISKRNSTFQVLASLVSNRQKRQQARRFVVEGVQPINIALAHGWQCEGVIYECGAALSRWAAGIVNRSSIPIRYEMTRDLLEELSGKDDTSELLAVVAMPDETLDRIPIRPNLLVAIVDRPSNPGNLGTLIRSCDAFGVHAVVVTGHAVDPYDPATITASRGSLFAIPVLRVASPMDLRSWIAKVVRTLGTCRVVGAYEKATLDEDQHDFAQPTVAVFGNETQGLSRAYQDLCDTMVRIPMVGSATSLNVSVAAAIILYEITRQRRSAADQQ